MKPRHGLLQFRKFVVILIFFNFFCFHFQLNLFGIMHLGNTGIAIGTGK